MRNLKPDFSGYATKSGIKCTDGRTICHNAFVDNDKKTVPLVWQHMHNDPANTLGHAVLENREDGVYAYGYFNDTENGKLAKSLVEHGDITALSIHANDLKQRGSDVVHGIIREVSLVVAGANPGALIENVSFSHADGTIEDVDDEAIIYNDSNLELSHEETTEEKEETIPTDDVNHADGEKTVADVFDTLNEEQKNMVYGMLTHALAGGDSADGEPDVNHSNTDGEGDQPMKKNVFDKEDQQDTGATKTTLTHSQIQEIIADAQKLGSFKESFLQHAVTYGIENIDYLFPDARNVSDSPDFVTRRMEWVTGVINGAKHSPFARIKSMSADITLDTARAKGYVKGALKKEEFFALAKRVTTPTTVYKKQKLDRDDIIDITDLDVVAWLKAEMRIMLDEEIARAILIGDGRQADDEDKINETNIRPIAKDDAFYSHVVQVAANTSGATLVEEILRQRTNYKGSGSPTFYTTEAILTDLLLVKDKMGRRLYPTEAELCSAIRVSSIVAVEVMEGVTDEIKGSLIGILVNMKDYTLGANKGGQVSMFDDFDIDYNQYKYLIEGRCSGALTKPKSALVFWRLSGTQATPTAPTFVEATNTITIPTVTGVVYSIDGVTKTGDIVITEDTVVDADPADTYYFAPNTTRAWTFTFTAGG